MSTDEMAGRRAVRARLAAGHHGGEARVPSAPASIVWQNQQPATLTRPVSTVRVVAQNGGGSTNGALTDAHGGTPSATLQGLDYRSPSGAFGSPPVAAAGPAGVNRPAGHVAPSTTGAQFGQSPARPGGLPALPSPRDRGGAGGPALPPTAYSAPGSMYSSRAPGE